MLYIKDIISLCDGELINGYENYECKKFITDSRIVNKGEIYVGIKGEKYNGNDFYREALARGADGCILERGTNVSEYPKDKFLVYVDDTIKCLGILAKHKRELFNKPVIAITGSVGKTTTKDMISFVLSTKYKVLSTKGNFNNQLGVPLTLLNLDDSYDLVVIEAGMNHFGELHYLSNIIKPTISIITNIGTAHIGNLGSRENILKAKLEILDGMKDGFLIINNDCDMLKQVKYDNLITVGIENESDYQAHDIVDECFKQGFYINQEYVNLPLGGLGTIYASLFAMAVGVKMGLSMDDVSDALREVTTTDHRLEVIKLKNYTLIDDTYNASLDSVKNALNLLNKVEGRRVFIFGDILELDTYGEEIHREIGRLLKELTIDIVVTVGTLANYTYLEISNNKKIESYHLSTLNEAVNEIPNLIKKGDTILVKASHGMHLEEVINEIRSLQDM